MTISDAAALGISRIRRSMWADKKSYAKIDLTDNGTHGPWLHLFDRRTQEILDEPTPQNVICVGDKTNDYVEYVGELDLADTH